MYLYDVDPELHQHGAALRIAQAGCAIRGAAPMNDQKLPNFFRKKVRNMRARRELCLQRGNKNDANFYCSIGLVLLFRVRVMNGFSNTSRGFVLSANTAWRWSFLLS